MQSFSASVPNGSVYTIPAEWLTPESTMGKSVLTDVTGVFCDVMECGYPLSIAENDAYLRLISWLGGNQKAIVAHLKAGNDLASYNSGSSEIASQLYAIVNLSSGRNAVLMVIGYKRKYINGGVPGNCILESESLETSKSLTKLVSSLTSPLVRSRVRL